MADATERERLIRDLLKATDSMLSERIDRLIAAQEVSANAMNRLAQALEKKGSKTDKPQRVRKTPKRQCVVSDTAERAAKLALARVRRSG